MTGPADLPGPDDHAGDGTRRVRRIASGIGVGVLTVCLLALVLLLSVSYRVIGASMLPGLHPGDRVVVNPAAYWFGPPQRGDVVAVLAPAGIKAPAVKRVIGLPGDQLEIRSPGQGQPPAVTFARGGKGHGTG